MLQTQIWFDLSLNPPWFYIGPKGLLCWSKHLNLAVHQSLQIMFLTQSLQLLNATVAAIVFTLCLVAGYTLSLDNLPPGQYTGETVGWCGTGGNVDEGDYTLGKKVWNINGCGACHNKNMVDNATGPALGGVTERWSAYPKEDLYAWVKNNPKLIASGHPKANEVWLKYSKVTMNTYPNLSDEDVKSVLAYIEGQYH